GVSADTDHLDQQRVIVSYSFFSSIHHSFILTYQYSLLTLKMIYKLFTGQANLKNISGPISIAEYTGKSLSMGLVYFAYILAILSISLGVLNLLPIPMLDGGHLMFYLFEIVTGNPISERIQLAGQQIGIIILFGIMILAFYNDFLRLLS
ncbi:MAG: site-2 protease family protein, partial [Pseudomonadota bacterium]|nr:site-2 protease family protein [Pseudomonadota bacterium]